MSEPKTIEVQNAHKTNQQTFLPLANQMKTSERM